MSKKPNVMSTGITKQWESSNPFIEKGSSEGTRYILVGKKIRGATELQAGGISHTVQGRKRKKGLVGRKRTKLQCGETAHGGMGQQHAQGRWATCKGVTL